MATTYLTLTNSVLRELNETELTSATFSSSRGIQTAVKDFINKGIHDIYNETGEIPLLYARTTQDLFVGDNEYDLPNDLRKVDMDSFSMGPKELVVNGEFTSNITNWTTGDGSPSHTTSGNGRLNLNDAAAYQSISTVKNKVYKLQVRVMSPSSSTSTVAIKVGTTASGGEVLSTTKSVTDIGGGAILNTTFTATAQTSYIYFETASGVQLDIDYVRISEDIGVKKLRYISYDDWNQRFAETDLTNSEDVQATPNYVYPTQDKKFGLSPIPDTDKYSITYEYWKIHTELSAHGDSPDLATQYQDIIVNRAKYYLYKLRSDVPAANIANAEFEEGVKRIRLDLIDKSSYMRDARVNLY
tara:strand:+ start:210 stop:1280 length:1071 start_codon:yes stop_codon:yes gene_type:complete